MRPPAKPTSTTSLRDLGLQPGITDYAEVWELPKGTLPKHPRYHNRRLFYKRHDSTPEYATSEYYMYKVFEMVIPDLCPTVFLIPGHEAASLMRWVGRTDLQTHRAKVTWGTRFNKQQACDVGHIDVVDTLCGNFDRHNGNLLRHGGRLIPIDHGLAFANHSLLGQGIRDHSFRCPKRHTHAYRAGKLAALDAIAANKTKILRLVNIARKHVDLAPLTAADVTVWIRVMRKKEKVKK